MGLLSEIKGLEYRRGMVLATTFFGTVACGFLIIFQFRPELIEKYDILKIVFLALALTMPLVVINLVNMVLLATDGEKKDKWDMLGATMFFNVFMVYPSLLVCYLFSLHFKWFLGMIAFLEFWYFLTGVYLRFFKRKTG